MSLALLPSPRLARMEQEATVSVGPASPLSFPRDAEDGVRQELSDWVRMGAGSAPVTLRHDPAMGPEASRVMIRPGGIELTAAGTTGWRHGITRLRQLGPLGAVPGGEIDDAPVLAMRGFHLNFLIAGLGHDEAIHLLEAMARWRLNTVLIEYDRRYPYRSHPAIPAPDALTREEIVDIVAHARRLGIEPIPLQQCLGHVNYILRHEAYAHLREEEEHRDQFCPLNKDSLRLFKEMVDDFVCLHPGIRYLHMGGDETRRLGVCPRCAAAAAGRGRGQLYVDFVTQAARHVLSLGITPIIWDDMLCRHREVIDQIPREVVIMYWDYWTTRDPSALFVARPEGLGVVADTGWQDRWKGELGETEGRTVRRFARPIDFERELSPEFREAFGRHLGPGFPKRIRAFPYLEYYQELGFRVIGAPTGCGNTSIWRGLPDFPRYGDNIGAFCRRLHEAGAMGVVTSAWYNVPPEALMPGLMFTGQFAWNTEPPGDQ